MTVYVGDNGVVANPANVLTYGADPTGASSSSTAFTNCAAASDLIYCPSNAQFLLSTAVEVSGKTLKGEGTQATQLVKNSTNGEILTVTPSSGTALTEICELTIANITTSPTSGSTIYMSSSGAGARLHHVQINGAYNGIELTASNGSWSDLVAISDIRIFHAINQGLYLHDNPNPVSLTDFVIWMLNGGSGYGIYLQNQVAAFVAENGEIEFGQYSLYSSATSNTVNNRPEWCRFTDVFFDSPSADSSGTGFGATYLTAMAGSRFKGCWFAAFGSPYNVGSGAYLASGVEDVGFTDCHFIDSPAHGAYVASGTKHIFFEGCAANGNSLASANTYSGIYFAANTTDFRVHGCTATSSSSIIGGTPGSGSQQYGICVATGTSDRYSIIGNSVAGNNSSGVNDGGSGSNKLVTGNY